MRKDELIALAKELNDLEDLKGRESDLYFLKREYNKLLNREEETFYEKSLTDEFISLFEKLAPRMGDLDKNALEAKKEIIQNVKNLLEKEQNGKNLSKAVDNLFNDFKQLPKLAREVDDELFAEFKKLREEVSKKVDEYYANLKASFNERKAKKEELISKAKEVLKLENIKDATAKMDALMNEWKAVGFAGKEVDDNLWNEFNEVRKEFSAKRKAHFENMKNVFEERANEKAEIIKKVKYITSEAYFDDDEIKQIKDLERQFRNIGFAGKEKDQQLWDDMQVAVKKYFEEMKFYK